MMQATGGRVSFALSGPTSCPDLCIGHEGNGSPHPCLRQQNCDTTNAAKKNNKLMLQELSHNVNVMSFLSVSQLQSLAPSIPQRNKGIGFQTLLAHFPQTRHSLSSESSTGTRLVGSHPSIWLF